MLIKPPLEIAKTVIKTLADLELPTRKDLMMVIRKTIKDSNYAFPTSIQLWEAYRDLQSQGFAKNEKIEKVLKVKDVRTDSGVAPITVLTKPYPCPGKCVYCPTEYRMPKSYISSEPAAARALSLDFDPYEQVKQRVQALERNGHTANKIELIVKGGTWSAYPKDYREWFITRCFQAANDLGNSPSSEGSSSPLVKEGHPANAGLEDSQSINETSAYRIIGLTIETRPDHITPDEIIHLRKLGVTRVELGLQIINDRVLELTGRGTTVADAELAITLLKNAAFKVDVHILPGQPGASREDDLESFKTLFDDPRFRPDMIKLYPCVVLPNSELYEITKRGDFKPLEGEDLRELLIEMQAMIPYYCRVSRLIRDFPTADISHGNKQTNLRESIESEMNKRGIKCKCLRCREVGHVPGDHTNDKTQLFEERYENAGGTEVFLSIENQDRSAVFGFCRLRLPKIPQSDDSRQISPFDKGAGCKVDELTIHGETLPYNILLKENANKLRNNQTLAEKKLWYDVLSKDQTGFRFLRQKPIDSFIADFYCSKLMLIIEVDGKIHEKQKEYDESRTYCLEDLGLKIIRYTNEEILHNLPDVKKDLDHHIQIRLNEIKQAAAKKASIEAPPRQRGIIAQSAIWGIYEAFPILKTSAQIRELHTYGTALNINQQNQEASQHKGYGRTLMARAEEIAQNEGYEHMAVISGIGVREYYKNLGYHEQDTYMVKEL